MKSNFAVSLIYFLLLEVVFLVRAKDVFNKPKSFSEMMEDQCNSHCVSAVNPILEANEKLKNKMVSLENVIKGVVAQLGSPPLTEVTDNSFQRRTNSGENNYRPSIVTQYEPNGLDSCPGGGQAEITSWKTYGTEPFPVSQCLPNARGWTVIFRRLNGTINFNRNWFDYKYGFGNASEEFFIGLEKLHLMTQEQPFELFIQLRQSNGYTLYDHYDDFQIGSEAESYKLKSVGKNQGTAQDSLQVHTGKMFSTFDSDNDGDTKNCAAQHGGGWWFSTCLSSSLNGLYFKNENTVIRATYTKAYTPLTFVQLLMRPKLF